MKNTVLEERLQDWAQEYAGGRYENLDYPSKSHVYQMMIYRGPAPSGLNPRGVPTDTPADEVESAVRGMSQAYPRQALVIRSEYWMQNKALEHRLQVVRSNGFKISQRTYERDLSMAKVAIADALGIIETNAAIQVLTMAVNSA